MHKCIFLLHACHTRYASRWLLKSQCYFMHNVLFFSHLSLSMATVFRRGKVIYCGYFIMHAVSLLCSDKMIGTGREKRYSIIQHVAPAGWTWCPPSSLIYRKSVTLATSPLSAHITVTSHNTVWHLSDWLTSCLNLQKVIVIRWHSMTRVWLDNIVFVPSDSSNDWLIFRLTYQSDSLWPFLFSCCVSRWIS